MYMNILVVFEVFANRNYRATFDNAIRKKVFRLIDAASSNKIMKPLKIPFNPIQGVLNTSYSRGGAILHTPTNF